MSDSASPRVATEVFAQYALLKQRLVVLLSEAPGSEREASSYLQQRQWPTRVLTTTVTAFGFPE